MAEEQKHLQERQHPNKEHLLNETEIIVNGGDEVGVGDASSFTEPMNGIANGIEIEVETAMENDLSGGDDEKLQQHNGGDE